MPVALGCLVVAALSLLVFREATYDPTAWLIWGRQIADGSLETIAGPSWKPLPVLFTTPLSLLGDTVALKLWLVLARLGGLLSLVMAYRVAARLGGRAAGVIAALALLLANEFLFNWIRGSSEGWLVATSLLAVHRHLDGEPRQAFGWGVATALLRPDVWPLLALYGLWLLRAQLTPRTVALVLGSGAAVLVGWFVPEYVGSGDLLRGASRARDPVAGSPGQADHPFLATFANASMALSYAVYAGAVLSLLAARRSAPVAAIAAASAVLMVIVALLASSGVTGNLRYVALPMALLCVLSGIGWAWLADRMGSGRARTRWVLVAAAAAAAPGVAVTAMHLARNLDRTRELDRIYAALPGFIERAGGRSAVLRCGPVFTGPFQTQAVAYRLHLRQNQVGIHPRPPGTILDATSWPSPASAGFALKTSSTEWTTRATC